VAPVWVLSVVHERASDLEFQRPGRESGYVGQIRMWKAANDRRRRATRIAGA
jgi:hypothetical protein